MKGQVLPVESFKHQGSSVTFLANYNESYHVSWNLAQCQHPSLPSVYSGYSLKGLLLGAPKFSKGCPTPSQGPFFFLFGYLELWARLKWCLYMDCHPCSTDIHLSSLCLSLTTQNSILAFLPGISLQIFNYYVTIRMTKILLLAPLLHYMWPCYSFSCLLWCVLPVTQIWEGSLRCVKALILSIQELWNCLFFLKRC